MNKYIKPSFTLASLVVTASATGGCSISKEEKNELIEIYGPDAFTVDGNCKVPVDGYCKFTSSEFTNPVKAFGS